MTSELMEKVMATRTLQDVYEISSTLCRELSLDYFIHVARVPESPNRFTSYVLSNFTGKGLDTPGGRLDGKGTWLLDRALEDTRPQVWSSLVDLALPISATRLPLAGAGDTFLSDGVMLGAHGGDGGKAVLCFAVREGSMRDRDIEQVLCLLHVMSPYVYTCLTSPATDATRVLSERERECLKWLIQGKTSWEVGKILGIAERTAEFHVGNILRKMDCRNRSQAIGKALLNGHVACSLDNILERVVRLDREAVRSSPPAG